MLTRASLSEYAENFIQHKFAPETERIGSDSCWMRKECSGRRHLKAQRLVFVSRKEDAMMQIATASTSFSTYCATISLIRTLLFHYRIGWWGVVGGGRVRQKNSIPFRWLPSSLPPPSPLPLEKQYFSISYTHQVWKLFLAKAIEEIAQIIWLHRLTTPKSVAIIE